MLGARSSLRTVQASDRTVVSDARLVPCYARGHGAPPGFIWIAVRAAGRVQPCRPGRTASPREWHGSGLAGWIVRSRPREPGAPMPRDHSRRADRALGARPTDVVRTRTYLIDRDDWEAIGRVHGEVFGEIRPASTMVVCRWLARSALEGGDRGGGDPRRCRRPAGRHTPIGDVGRRSAWKPEVRSASPPYDHVVSDLGAAASGAACHPVERLVRKAVASSPHVPRSRLPSP